MPSRRSRVRERPQPSKETYLVTIRDPSSHRHLVLDGMSDEAASRACAAAGQGQRQRARRDGRGAPGPPPDRRPRRAPHGVCCLCCSLRAGLISAGNHNTLFHTHINMYTHNIHALPPFSPFFPSHPLPSHELTRASSSSASFATRSTLRGGHSSSGSALRRTRHIIPTGNLTVFLMRPDSSHQSRRRRRRG